MSNIILKPLLVHYSCFWNTEPTAQIHQSPTYSIHENIRRVVEMARLASQDFDLERVQNTTSASNYYDPLKSHAGIHDTAVAKAG